MRHPGKSHRAALVCFAALSMATLLRATSYDCTAISVPFTPSGINNGGVIVGSANGHGFIRDPGGNVRQIDYPGQTNTQLFTINNHGVIIGQWGTLFGAPGTFGFFTVDLSGNFQNVSFPPPYDAQVVFVHGINDDGAILGGAPLTAFILKPDGTVTAIPASGLSPSSPGCKSKKQFPPRMFAVKSTYGDGHAEGAAGGALDSNLHFGAACEPSLL
jgi:hypothetical protein